jgi:O-antigen/teichoic acid export membrane protein
VGGIAVLPDIAESGSSRPNCAVFAALAGAAVVVLTAAAWYARRRRLRQHPKTNAHCLENADVS